MLFVYLCIIYDLSENVGKETILKVTDWLRGIWEMRRRTGPVQQWIDSIPLPTKSDVAITSECEDYMPSKPLTPTEPKDIPFTRESKPPSMTISAPINVPNSPAMSVPVLPRYCKKHMTPMFSSLLQLDQDKRVDLEYSFQLQFVAA